MLNTWIYPKLHTHASIGVKKHIFHHFPLYIGEAPLTRIHYITNPNNALFYKIPPPKKNLHVHCLFSPEKTVFNFMIPAYCTNCFASALQTPTSKTYIGTSMAKSLHILRCFLTTCCGNGSTNLGKKTIYARNLQNPDVALCGIPLY